MVKYKNFGTSGQAIGSFSFSSQNSQHSTKTTRTGKSSKSKSHRRNERSPSITRRESEEDDCRDEDGSRFDPRILPNDSTEEEDIKEGEAESLYDMISYNGITDENSLSVCASYSYSAGETDSSAGFSDLQQPMPKTRSSKLAYMGYLPMSPNTAAAMATKEMREHSQTHRHRNGNNDVNSAHTTGEATNNSGSTFPSIKVDDTSTSRRRQRNYDDEEQREQQEREEVESASVVADDSKNITEYITVGQERFLENQKILQQQQIQSTNKNSTTVTSSSVADHTLNSRIEDGTIATSVASSVMPNSLTGHPAMMLMNKGRQNQQQQQQQQHGKPNNGKSTKQDFKPLSPVVVSPKSEHQLQTPKLGHEAWHDNASFGLSPLTAGVSANGMMPPSLNHPPAMMQQHWNLNHGVYRQQFGYQQQQPVQNYPNHHLHRQDAYGPGGNYQQSALHQHQHQLQQHQLQQQQQQQQNLQGFQSGFFPRNPVLARQLQAFHQYHNQEQQQKDMAPPMSPPSMSRSPEEPQGRHPAKTPRAQHNLELEISKNNDGISSSQQNKREDSTSDDHPFLICGPEGPRLMDSVKFVTPIPQRASGSSISSNSKAYGASYSEGTLGTGCGQHPAGMKCQSYVASFINTCGAIVSHGYHIDNRKSSSKEKRAKFGKVAEKSIAGLAPSDGRREEEVGNIGIGSIGSGLNDALAANAKKFLHAGNHMMNTLPKDFQNLTQSAAYHNVFDTFQKYAPVTSPVQSDQTSMGLRSALSDDPTEVEEATGPKDITLSPISAHREHFKKLRRRRKSPIRKSIGEGNAALSPTSPKAEASENLKFRYRRNLHTKLHNEKLEKANVADDAGKPNESNAESQTIRKPNEDPNGSKDDDSNDSWATPMSQEESQKDNRVSVKPDPSVGGGSPVEKSIASDSLEEVLGEKASEDVVLSASSGMSDSLVGSDMGDDEEPQLDSMMNSSLSEDEIEEHLLLGSYDHNEFPHTPLHVIEEGSEDEDTIKNSNSKDLSIDAPMDEHVVDSTQDDELYTGSMGRKTISMIGIIRIMFVAMLSFQCGTIICLWDQIAEQIRTIEGGPEILANVKGLVSNLKASGASLVTTAQDIINVNAIDIPVGDIISEIESRTTELMGTANQFLVGLAVGTKLEQRQNTYTTQEEDNELQLFHQLVDEALWADDDVLKIEVSEEEEVISITSLESMEEKSDCAEDFEQTFEDAVER